jgi:hypothetical protein
VQLGLLLRAVLVNVLAAARHHANVVPAEKHIKHTKYMNVY